MANETRLFHCANGKVYACKEKCCLFCDHCTDIFYDYTNGPYMWLCDFQKDTEIGAKGLCKYFEEGIGDEVQRNNTCRTNRKMDKG